VSQYQELFSQIQSELGKIERAVQTNTKLVAALESVEEGSDAYDGIIGGIAMNLQSAYTGIERILTAISKQVDDVAPEGSQWHRNLLAQMVAASENRPAVLSPRTVADLRLLLGFRHIVRNAYSYTLDADKVLENADRLLGCFTNFAYDCLALQCVLTDSMDSEQS
jgi:hypothetical protein